jgi:hypothetical protein
MQIKRGFWWLKMEEYMHIALLMPPTPLHQRIDHMPAPFPTKWSMEIILLRCFCNMDTYSHAKTIDDYEELRKMASACDPEMKKGG